MTSLEELGIVLPPGVERPAPVSEGLPDGRGLIVNGSDLPDQVVQEAVESFFETSSMLGANSPTSFALYQSQGGSLLTRGKLRMPQNVIEEIILARDLAERDDDIGAVIGAAVWLAFGEPFLNTHTDEVVIAQYDELSTYMKLQHRVFPEMYRELLIASQFTTATIFMRDTFQFTPPGADRQRSRSLACPLVGVIPAEQIRVLGNDLFGTADLAYRPFTGTQERWLEEFFHPQTSAGRKAEMRRDDPLLTTLLTEQILWDDYLQSGVGAAYGDAKDPGQGRFVYKLNPTIIERTSLPKGQWPYPRPLLTRNFPLLEAKRLLNILDYGLLEGGCNFLVIVKKGSDDRPAMPEEITNLRETIKRASRTGVIVGDHRLNVEIITPDLEELLNEKKRNLISRKLAAGLLRVPDFAVSEDTSGGSTVDAEILSRVVAGDRGMLVDHIQRTAYKDAAARNDNLAGAAKIWFPKIVLQGLQFWTDMVLKLRDRGDIPRKYGVEAAGFNYEAGVAQRKLEKANGDDRALTAPPVPFSAPGGGPQDNGGGRPPGGSSANGRPGSQPSRTTADPARPKRLLTSNAGETVRAFFEEQTEETYRVGELTQALLEEYSATAREGRVTQLERDALARMTAGETGVFAEGPLTIIPVNTAEEIGDVRAIQLDRGLRILVGNRPDDGAILTAALAFRAPDFKRLDAEELAIRFGWEPPEVQE